MAADADPGTRADDAEDAEPVSACFGGVLFAWASLFGGGRGMISAHIDAILMVTGWITMKAIIVSILPAFTLRVIFGVAQPDPAMKLIAQHWGLLVSLVGVLLVVTGYNPAMRVPVMVVAVTEKLAIGALVLGSPLRTRPLTVAIIAIDAVIAAVYLVFLW